jgi:hypothetical protein
MEWGESEFIDNNCILICTVVEVVGGRSCGFYLSIHSTSFLMTYPYPKNATCAENFSLCGVVFLTLFTFVGVWNAPEMNEFMYNFNDPNVNPTAQTMKDRLKQRKQQEEMFNLEKCNHEGCECPKYHAPPSPDFSHGPCTTANCGHSSRSHKVKTSCSIS